MKENATKPFEKLVSLLCLEGPIFTPGHDVEERLRVTCVGDLKKRKNTDNRRNALCFFPSVRSHSLQ